MEIQKKKELALLVPSFLHWLGRRALTMVIVGDWLLITQEVVDVLTNLQ